MKCIACQNEYPSPEMIDGTAYFVCSSCGDIHEVENYCAHTKEDITKIIEAAFSGVVLGKGIGLFEAQALDDYEPEEVQKIRRQEDEKLNWTSISNDVLQRCHSSLSFFDADGMKFHLPAYILGDITGDVDDPVFHLTDIGVLTESRFGTLNALQTKAVIDYLTWCLTEEKHAFDFPNIARALTKYWRKLPIYQGSKLK